MPNDTPGFTPVTAQSATPGFTPVQQATPTPTEQPGAVSRFLTGAKEEVKGLAKGAMSLSDEPQTATDKALYWAGRVTGTPLMQAKRAIIDPAIQKGQSTAQAFKSGDYIKGGLGAAATLNPLAPDVTKLYEQSASGDVSGASGRGLIDVAAISGGEVLSKLQPHLDATSKILDRQVAINKGRVGLANDARRAALTLQDAVTGPTGEVGKHAQAVIAADKLDLQRTQSEGKVNGVDASLAGQAVIDKTKMGGVAHGFKAQMSMDEAKAAITQLGREGSKLERSGRAPEAAAVWAEYDALRKATLDRAKQLGPDYARSWGHYSDEFHNFIQLKKGLFGDLLEDPDHVSMLRKLTDPDVAAQIPEIKDWFKKYKVNSEPIDYAQKQGMKLDELNQQSKNMFMGKLRAIVRHPITAGTAAAGASIVGHASGVPGMGFVLPLIVAGKVAGIIDAADTVKLLRDVTKKVGAAAQRVTPEAQGPMPLPQPPSGGGGVTLAPAGGAVGTGPLEETPKPSPQEVEDIRRESGLPLGEQGVQERITGRSDLAEKLKGARRSRGTGVYKGSRGRSKP